MSSRVKLVVLDLDLVLWDHRDVTSLELPLKRVDDRTVVDSRGDKVTLRDGVEEFLKAIKERGILLSTCSWNELEKAVAVLKAFSLDGYFDLLMIEPHPEKDLMMEKILEHFRSFGISEDEVLFIDDRSDMLEKVKRKFPGVRTLRFHPDGDAFSFHDLKRYVLGE
ncbi:MAG: magnesium-dependent phosphatase-1 [Candidatus Korarchaeota archaeon]|nr:magnesium-dependent phosphatase-1 [Candidatus Korarchaeota archaeon]